MLSIKCELMSADDKTISLTELGLICNTHPDTVKAYVISRPGDRRDHGAACIRSSGLEASERHRLLTLCFSLQYLLSNLNVSLKHA